MLNLCTVVIGKFSNSVVARALMFGEAIGRTSKG
jgi:hypothetical protein